MRLTLLNFIIITATATAPSALAAPISSASVDTLEIISAVEEDSLRSTVTVDTVYYASEDAPLQLEMITVSARRVSRVAGADRIELDQELLDSHDAITVSDLSTLLPSTKLTVNSRGEALFMVRGSSERHVRVELDGIPLTVPWDERADLSMLPLLAIGEVRARRGVNSALEEPNTLAGTVELSTRDQILPGSSSRVGAYAGEASAWGAQGLHQRRHGRWSLLAAAEYRRRDGFLLPADADPGLHQNPARRLRLNSQFEQTSALVKAQREFSDDGRAHLLVQFSEGNKGVPPEEHLAEARFWRYPKIQRVLVGARLQTPSDRTWRLDSSASADFFAQDIDSYPDATYGSPDGFEEGRDRTGFWRVRIERSLTPRSDFRLRTTARYTEHVERTNDLPDELKYSPLLMGAAAEVEHRFAGSLEIRAGAGYEGALTPQSGDKPDRDADHEFAVQGAVEGRFAEDGRWYLNGSHRPRMPSLREMYSGALGSFEPNDALEPERQDAIEAGMSWESSRWNFSVNGFAQRLEGAIERVTLESGQRQRVNLDEVRNLGIEIGSVVKPVRGLSFDLQGTWLHSRAADEAGNFDRRVEDRPDWLTTLAGTWTHRSGLRLRVELDGVGARYSLDARKTDPTDPFTRLDATARLNLRLSWRHFGDLGGYAGSEWYVRLDDVLDEQTFSQLGLIESGRMVRAGVRVDFDR
jgi:iron complex outermembrane receptor protein